eukprot:5955771-Lingulodinium_polyedra.AAC.1
MAGHPCAKAASRPVSTRPALSLPSRKMTGTELLANVGTQELIRLRLHGFCERSQHTSDARDARPVLLSI